MSAKDECTEPRLASGAGPAGDLSADVHSQAGFKEDATEEFKATIEDDACADLWRGRTDPTRRERIKDYALDKTPKKLRNPSALQVRFRTGFIYVTVSVLCLVISGWTTLALLAATAGICAGEFYYMLRSDAKLPNEMLGIIGAVLYPVCVFFFGVVGVVYACLATLIALLVWYVFWQRARVPDVGVSFFGAAYCGLLLCGVLVIRGSLASPWGGVLVLLLFLSVWANDSFAYLVGSKFGKHKLAPRTSPKKSWEGFFAGLVGSAVFWALMSFVPGDGHGHPGQIGRAHV